jgi:hypothetical protein
MESNELYTITNANHQPADMTDMSPVKKITPESMTPDLFEKLLEHALNLEHIKTKLDGLKE